MDHLADMIWIELRKAARSKVPAFTGVGFLIAPLASAFMMFIYKDPQFARRAGLISVKAELMAATADWPTYLNMLAQAVGVGGIILFSLAISWVFGREFADGTVKDLLAVPVARSSILLAKFIVTALWSAGLTLEIYLVGLVLGVLVGLPQGSAQVILHGSVVFWVTAGLVILVILPFGFFASVGRGYLLPIGVAILAVALANIVALIGYGSHFPWSVPGLFAGMGGSSAALTPLSYGIVVLTGLAGIIVTYWWWMYADQSR
jgi:ABC-2 type transport system permease protein